ncbi:MAG: FAD:protein FMN transferase [Alphaproteobacteria bacterium]|nr:FAD:protein FMN transferase [Alphaproteobacteria bacterium]
MRFFQYISILLIVVLVGIFIYSYSPHYKIIKGEIFGTYYNIKIRTDNKNSNLKAEIEQKLQEINNSQSVFETQSEISELNRAKAGKKIALSPIMRHVLKAADLVYYQTNGAFDPSLGRLIELWGFGASEPLAPSTKQIKTALQSSGFNKLKFSQDYQYVAKTNSSLLLNLSAIAKGYGVDAVAQLLDEEGYHDYIVEIGGEIKTKGYRTSSGEPWTIGINKPSPASGENILVLSLSNMAVATSGNYRNFYNLNGKTYGHTISSQTGYPVETDVLSASVFHDSCMMADAYATAIVAMGVEKGLKFAERHKLKVIIYDLNYQQHISAAAADMF